MGGRIWVESAPGKGSTFTFTILARAASSAQRVALSSIESLKDKRILIVDDNATNRQILSAQIQSWGMSARAFASGPAALEQLGAGATFDLAILDMAMPEMDGLMLATEMRRLNTPTPVPMLLLSSLGRQRLGDADQALFVTSLTKPVKPSILYDAIISVFAGQPVAHNRRFSEPQVNASLFEHAPQRLLLAEDNVVNQKVALRMLERLGYRADVVANGAEVLQALDRAPYDTILMDVQMPEMDGMEATRQIRQRETKGQHIHIIAMTAHAMQGDREQCLAAGMDDYVAKPVQIHELARALLKAIGAEMATPAPATPAPGNLEEELPAFDKEALDETLKNVCDGDVATLTELIDLYLADSPNILALIEKAIADHDAKSLTINAHSLKSSSRMMGASAVAALCTDLEIMGRNKALAGAAEKMRQLGAAFARAQTALRAQMSP